MLSRTAQEMIPIIRTYLSTQPVIKAWLFGSYSRGEENPDSDVDILVQYKPESKISLFGISRIMVELSELLNKKVDLVEYDCLLPFAKPSADRDKILIFEANDYETA